MSVLNLHAIRAIYASEMARTAAGWMGLEADVQPEDVSLTFDQIGPGYGASTAGGLEAIALLARTEGVLLDPAYTAKAMAGLLEPTFKEVRIGSAEVRETFKVPKFGTIAGCMVLEGRITRSGDTQARLVRDNVVVYEGRIGSLRRFKDDVSEVKAGFECGIGFEKYNDIKVGDVIEAFVVEPREAHEPRSQHERVDPVHVGVERDRPVADRGVGLPCLMHHIGLGPQDVFGDRPVPHPAVEVPRDAADVTAAVLLGRDDEHART